MKAFEYVDVDSAEAAVKQLPAGVADEYKRDTFLKAGGIDLLDQMKERMLEPDKLLNLRPAEESLRYIKVDGDVIRIGPLTTMHELATNAEIKKRFAALATSADQAATPQIRNVATVGGNLCQRPRCWYFRNAEFNCIKKGGDVCFAKEGENQYHGVFGRGPSYIVHPSNLGPALVAVDADIDVHGPDGKRTIKASKFFTMPSDNVMRENVLESDDVITEIRVPANLKGSSYVDFREKQSYDWPLVASAAVHTPAGWKVVLGAVAPVPWQSEPAEAVLGNKSITPELAASAGAAAIKGATPLRYNAYKLDLIKAAVRRSVLEAAGMEVV